MVITVLQRGARRTWAQQGRGAAAVSLIWRCVRPRRRCGGRWGRAMRRCLLRRGTCDTLPRSKRSPRSSPRQVWRLHAQGTRHSRLPFCKLAPGRIQTRRACGARHAAAHVIWLASSQYRSPQHMPLRRRKAEAGPGQGFGRGSRLPGPARGLQPPRRGAARRRGEAQGWGCRPGRRSCAWVRSWQAEHARVRSSAGGHLSSMHKSRHIHHSSASWTAEHFLLGVEATAPSKTLFLCSVTMVCSADVPIFGQQPTCCLARCRRRGCPSTSGERLLAAVRLSAAAAPAARQRTGGLRAPRSTRTPRRVGGCAAAGPRRSRSGT